MYWLSTLYITIFVPVFHMQQNISLTLMELQHYPDRIKYNVDMKKLGRKECQLFPHLFLALLVSKIAPNLPRQY